MRENTNEKSLVKVNENSIFYKLKHFFKNLFHKNKHIDAYTSANVGNIRLDTNKFMEDIKKIEDKETLLLKLQKKYRNGEIAEEDLTDAQVNSLCILYDKQISNLKKSNEIRKQKLLEYRKRLRTDN